MTFRQSHHYGDPLTVKVTRGQLAVVIGVDTLAHALKFAEWAIRFDEQKGDYLDHGHIQWLTREAAMTLWQDLGRTFVLAGVSGTESSASVVIEYHR